MQRVMIIGQPGSGKSTLARKLGEITFLPVVHIDHIHWQDGWIERSAAQKLAMCAEVHARELWIFEGGHSRSWPERLARADTLIWLDLPLATRAWRVFARTLRYWRRNRPDLSPGCPERFDAEFWHYIWRTRHTSRQAMHRLYQGAPPDKQTYRLRSAREVRIFLEDLSAAVAVGNLGIPHR